MAERHHQLGSIVPARTTVRMKLLVAAIAISLAAMVSGSYVSSVGKDMKYGEY